MGLSSNSQIFSLDTNTNLWEPIRTKPYQNSNDHNPPEIDEHSAVVANDEMFIFGGFVEGDRTNNTYKYNFKLSEWQLLECSGQIPSARAGHQAVVVYEQDKPFMYVFGGKDNQDNLLNDMWRLNLQSFAWQQVNYASCANLPRGR